MDAPMSVTHLSLYVTADEEAMAGEAARIIASQYRRAIDEKGLFTIALSGGKTPLPLFRLLARPEWSKVLDWTKIVVYWTDERCVSPESEDCNYRAARAELLSRVDATRYYRMKGEDIPEKAAKAYSDLLSEHFGLSGGALPRFDCILLGVGTDGHTASLFPRDPALSNNKDMVLDIYPPGHGSPRLTLSLPVLNNAGCCIFLASGRGKHHILSTALNLMAAPALPAQMVRPHSGELCWIIDDTAYQG
jgi:6-phosphogluconolactonase